MSGGLKRSATFLLVTLGFLGLAALAVGQLAPEHVVPATELAVMPLVSVASPPEIPETPEGRALVAHLDEIARTTTSSRYAHQTDVDVARGRYHWDCSGMVGWLMRRHAPAAFAALGRSRPVAADYAREIRSAPTEPGRAWQRIERIEDVRAGDVFAWRSPPELRTENNTGHVGIVLGRPTRALAGAAVWAVRIADSTTLPHERDSRLTSADRDGGLGTGVMTFAVDEAGAVTHYGWMGVLSPIYLEADVVFGRLAG